MYSKNRHLNDTRGFTLVELLIVIVFIVIIAAISTAAYAGIQERAIASAVTSDLVDFSKKIEVARLKSSDDLYPFTPTLDVGLSATKSAYMQDRTNWYYCRIPARTDYRLGVMDNRGKTYFLGPDGTIEKGGNLDGATMYWKLGAVTGTGCSHGFSWNSSTSTGTWATWTN